MSDNGTDRGTFTTSKGVVVHFIGIAPLLDKLNAQFTLPDAPFYEIKTVAGATEKHLHDETTVSTDEERKALADYKAECARVNAEHQAKLTRLILLRGIRFDYPTDDVWVKEQTYLGIHVPAEPMERKLHYIETEVIANVEDVETIMLGVMEASGVPEDLLQQVEATFRGAVGQAGRNETSRPADTQDGTGMVLQPTIRASTGGDPNGDTPKRIRRPKRRG